ncbi:MAG: WhiB family transcriptional regulator [Propionibacteriaceae bacterium]
MSISTLSVSVPACTTLADLFQHQLLEDPPAASALTASQRRLTAAMTARAAQACEGCPFKAQCLHDAIVQHDVAGYVAGTTLRERNEIRKHLGVRVESEDLDTLAGVITPHRQVNHEEVLRLRRANPDESLDTIAHRLGCSLSTVKRHLRKARAAQGAALAVVQPTRDQVWDAVGECRKAPRRRVAVVA